jgi:hypothetical protein
MAHVSFSGRVGRAGEGMRQEKRRMSSALALLKVALGYGSPSMNGPAPFDMILREKNFPEF